MPDEQRWKLDETDFWRLLARVRDVDAKRSELRALVLDRQQQITAAAAECRKDWEATADVYGFDAKADYRFDEQTTELVRTE